MKRDFVIVLVRPRDPNNIGATARAMANFGLSQLRVVDPYEPTWQSAVSAVGAHDILQNAQLCATLPEALADCTLSLAATALKNRKLDQDIVALPRLPLWLTGQNAGQTALVFGNEKTGLSNADIALCQAVLHIPTTAKQPSVNLAQAVILTCYELARTPIPPAGKTAEGATFAEQERVLAELDALLQAVQIKTDYSAEQRKALLRGLLHKSHLSKNDLFFIKTVAEYARQKIEERPL